MSGRGRIAIAALTLVAIGSTGGIYAYGAGGSERFKTARSPGGEEAVEFYTATRWQRWFGPAGDLVGYVGLRRLSDGAMVATSAPFALSGEGEVFWSDARVQVGTSAAYDRTSKRWTLLQ